MDSTDTTAVATGAPLGAGPAAEPPPRLLDRRRSLLALAVGIPISAFFLWLAVREVDLSAVRATLADARVGYVAAAVAAMGGVYVVQAIRWRRIAGAPWLRRRRFLDWIVSGVACSNVLPARAGDLLRAHWLSRAAPMPGGRALATVVVDRASDLLVLLAFLIGSAGFVTRETWVDRLVLAAIGLVALVGLILLAGRTYARRRDRGRRAHRGRLRRIVRDLVDTFGERVSAGGVVLVLALSVAAWATWALGAIAVGRSVGLELSFTEALFVTGVLNLGVAIPSSPGFVGTYQWLGVASLGLLDVPKEEALAFAILMQAVWFVPTTLVGGVLVLRRIAGRAR